ncbi:methanogen output domain 1-containing protein [Candidatus Nitrospira neomarina]|uniref:Methanogen output domain 1-containing protein n=1 Tax=Candidatus Nitrospira neomarina TaxID=3020899 RepID=A0AA96JVT1_9BACT|nr:methanogen output domain 1-containing protein [Candidatus Nitrospira neomarina]WNM61813.1 methanogen output domain 1-containing protein [Candidatus Nitrospira neomarina]
MKHETKPSVKDLPMHLDRDLFTRVLIRELSGTLQDVVGLEEASGFISLVGQTMGEQINHEYQKALSVDRLTREEVRDVLVDLKRRIQGDFYVIEENDDKIVLGNRRCPFGDKVLDRPALCMMTSNVFGSITADNLGYSKVELQETIAKHDQECRIIVHLRATPESAHVEGREYFKGH